VNRPNLDPGPNLTTPSGTGPLGRPNGNGDTWGDPGAASPTITDGTESNATQSSGFGQGIQDGSGSR
jgi:hypothetical protein